MKLLLAALIAATLGTLATFIKHRFALEAQLFKPTNTEHMTTDLKPTHQLHPVISTHNNRTVKVRYCTTRTKADRLVRYLNMTADTVNHEARPPINVSIYNLIQNHSCEPAGHYITIIPHPTK